MKLQDSVSTITGSVKLPASVTAYLQHNKDEFEEDDMVKGGVLQDFKFAWLANSSKFVVINIKTGHKIAAWTFGAVLRDFKTSVMCVCEIPSLIENTKQLLIGLECDMIGGLVCLFHCQGSRVLRAIRLDCRVSCIEYVDKFPSGPLQCFDGTVIIGTHGGSVLAFDLNKQSCIEAIMFGKSGKEVLIRDELNIGNLFTLSMEDIGLIEEQRNIACEKDDHIAIQVNEGCFHNLQFILHGPDNSVRLRATRERVFVTSLLYIPQLGSIVIGFHFGAFQLWNILTLELEYTSPVATDQLPISHFGFLEPCDDPRAFSYLWVIYSSLDRHEEGFPLAAMYAFSYQGKTSLGDDGYLYQNFISCNLRFNVELSSVDASSVNIKQMVGGRGLACHTLTKAVGRSNDSEESVLNLCQIVWECWTVSAITPVQSMMIIFDIDQWYKEQMPELTTLESNSFLSVVNLGDTLSHTASCYLCDVRINKDSLSPYYSVPRLEEHYYPNSLGYECVCLTNTDVTRLTTMGVQRQLLSSLSEIGPSVLLHPTKVFMQSIGCGLIPLYVEPSPNPTTPLPKQRQTILSIALEARLICFLSDCARDWATGCHSSIGCSLASFTQWAWSRAMTLKWNADQLTIPLFDHSRDGPDGNSVSCLESCTRQLGHLAKLFNIMLDKCANLMLPEAIKEVKQKQKAVQVVSLYFQVVQWFLNVGLLPEFSMNSQHLLDRDPDRLPYPVDSLVRYYQNRRLKLHCLNGENPAVENLQNKSCSLLFIDQFIKMECCEDKLKRFWLDDGSDTKGLYPPPSLLSLLRTYLIPGILDENKHSLVLYVLVDYAMTFDEAQYESVIRRLMQFPTMFGLSNNAIKLTQAFWHLDHRDFELALDQLESVVAGGWLKQWQHNVALSSLLVQNKTQAALQYLYVRKPFLPLPSTDRDAPQTSNNLYDNDWETCCNLYLSRGLLLEAFNLTKDSLRTLSSPDLREQRMILFLEGCKKMNLLSKALMLPLSEEEETILTNFLKALGDSDAHDLLIMYYLQRSRFIEAQHVNDNLKRLSTKGQLPYDISSDFSMKKDHIPKTKTRDELVDMYCKTLPKVTRSLAHLASQHVFPNRMSMPTPMTVNLQAIVPKPATYRSSVIQATINKANETWLERPGVARNLKRALQVEDTPFICTPKMERHTSRLNDFEKMITTPENMIISPAKRPRLAEEQEDDTESCVTTPEDPKVRKEVESLLHTPIVERRTHWRCESRTDSTREATPQSILKVRAKMLEGGGSSIDERLYAETDEEFDTASVNTQSDNLSRSIRFNIPSPGNTPSRSLTPTDLNDSYEELSGIRPFAQSSIQTFSPKMAPRKGIHQTLNYDDEDMSPVVDMSTPLKRTPLRGRKLISPSNSSNADDSFTFENQPTELLFEEEVDQQNVTATPSHDEVDRLISSSQCVKVNEAKEIISDVESNVDENESTIVQSSKSEDVESCRKTMTPSSEIRERLKRGPQPRRSLRNTPERESTENFSMSRVLRSRSRTPEREICSPVVKLSPSKSTPGQKTKKSLARIVLEANALSVSKIVTKSETVTESYREETKIEQDTTLTDNTSKYQSLIASKLIESMCTQNDSLLCSDVSEVDTDVSFGTEAQEENPVPNDEIVITEIPVTKEEEERPIIECEIDTSIITEPDEESENADELSPVDRNLSIIEEESADAEVKESPIDQSEVVDNEPGEINIVVTPEKQETLNAIFSKTVPCSYENLNEYIGSKATENVVIENVTEDVDMEDINMDDNDIDIVASVYDKDPVQIDEQLVETINNQDIITDEESNSLNLVIDTDVCEPVVYQEPKTVSIVQNQPDESLLHSESDSTASSDSEDQVERIDINDVFEEDISSENREEVDHLKNVRDDSSDQSDEGKPHRIEDESSNAESGDNEGASRSSGDQESGSSTSQSQTDESLQDSDDRHDQGGDSDVIHIVSSEEDESNSHIASKHSNSQTTGTTELQDGPQTSGAKVAETERTDNTHLVEIPCNVMTQEELKNMSLMTEEGSMLEDPISLKLSEDEDEGQQNAMNMIQVETEEKITKSYDPVNLNAELDKASEFLSKTFDNVEEIEVEESVANEVMEEGKVDKLTPEMISSNDKQESTVESAMSSSDIVMESVPVTHSSTVDESKETFEPQTIDVRNGEDVEPMLEEGINKVSSKDISMEQSEKHVESVDNRMSESNAPGTPGLKSKTGLVLDEGLEIVVGKNTAIEATDNVKATAEVSRSELKSNKDISTPKRVTRRRSSAQSDTSTTIQTTPENKTDSDSSSIARSTRSASKKKQLSKDGHSPGSEKSTPSVEDDRRSVSSNASSSKKSIATESSSPPNKDGTTSSSLRKPRKSTFSMAVPNLSVIPEISQAELDRTDLSKLSRDTTENDSTLMEQYISSRRVTRHQRSVLEKSFANSSVDTSAKSRKPRRSSAGPSNVTEDTIYEDTESEASERYPRNVTTPRKSLVEKSMDPIDLMNKQDFKGHPDPDEMSYTETVSVSSRSSSFVSEYADTMPNMSLAARSKRAASETISSIAEVKKMRRLSVDAVLSPVRVASPSTVLDESVTDSAGRPRRRSFNKAVEALSTPKRRRRMSTDSKNDTDGEGDTSMSDRATPNIFRERVSEMNQSKLLAIEEDAAGEGNFEKEASVATPKPVKKLRKAASLQHHQTPDQPKDVKKSRTRMSQLLTPLSKEEQEDLEDVKKPRFRRRTTMHKVIQPIEFVLKKK